jgi:hypothetical protein
MVQAKRRRHRAIVRRIEPQRLVFVDETGMNTSLTKSYARTPRGQRAVGSVPTS